MEDMHSQTAVCIETVAQESADDIKRKIQSRRF